MLYQLSYFRNVVPRTGLEPACLSTHAPETCASTNSATWALTNQKPAVKKKWRGINKIVMISNI